MRYNTHMKPVVGIFAHPDDEAFGPGGTLAMLAKEREVYLICVTNGEAGMNSSQKTHKLADIRREELLKSAKILGVKEVFFLGYKDGTLCNNLYHEVAEKIKDVLEEIKPEIIITHDMRGGSGHLDHIATAMISSFVFQKIDIVREIWYHVTTLNARKSFHNYFVFVPPGYKKSEISKVINIEAVWEQKLEAMHQHESQKHDIDKLLARFKNLPREDNFVIVKKY